jgi:hypothetical protein
LVDAYGLRDLWLKFSLYNNDIKPFF